MQILVLAVVVSAILRKPSSATRIIQFPRKWETRQERETVYGSLGCACGSLGDLKKAIEHLECDPKIAKE